MVNSVACKCALNVTRLGMLESKTAFLCNTHVKVLILLLSSNVVIIRSQASARSSTHQEIKEHTFFLTRIAMFAWLIRHG
jgi:hypothetical protein